MKGYQMEDITVITPFNRDIDRIIKAQQEIFLSDSERRVEGGFNYCVGDRMMQTKNVYLDDYDLMNGEEGVITTLGQETFVVDYGRGKEVEYSWKTRPEKPKSKKKKSELEEEDLEENTLHINDVKHSFCKTVHKSQGSEYKFVILYIPRNLTGFVNINLLYTAITRTKEKIWIVCDKESLDLATTKYLPHRYEKLSDRLRTMRQDDESIMTDVEKLED